MAVQRCESCSAPLPLSEPSNVVECPHCNVENYIKAQVKNPFYTLLTDLHKTKSQPHKGHVSIFMLATILTMVASAILFSILTIRSEEPIENQPLNMNTQPKNEPVNNKMISFEALARLDEKVVDNNRTSSWIDVDMGELPIEYTSFDYTTILKELLNKAQIWTEDVQLERIVINHVPSVETNNVSNHSAFNIDLRFYSPSKYEAYKNMIKVSEKKIPWKFRFTLKKNHLSAMVYSADRNPFPQKPMAKTELSCSISDVLSTMKSKGLPMRPFYNLTYRIRYNKWVWVADYKSKHLDDFPKWADYLMPDCSSFSR